MDGKIRRAFLAGVLTTVAATCALTAAPVRAQDLLTESVAIFSGSPSRIGDFTVGAWGSGTSKFSTKVDYNKKPALEIVTKDLGEGARIDMKKPVDMTSFFANQNAFLQLVVSFRSATPKANPYADMAGAGGGMGRRAMPTLAPQGNPRTATASVRPTNMLVALVLDSGEILESRVPVSAFQTLGDGWMNINYPLAILKKNRNLNQYLVKRVIVSGDGSGTFYLGEIRVIVDSSDLHCSAGNSREVARLEKVTFKGTSTSGATPVKYSWDFGESKTGVWVDAVGPVVKHQFRAKGDYVVTLTVSDIFGLKAPAVSTIKVHVNQ